MFRHYKNGSMNIIHFCPLNGPSERPGTVNTYHFLLLDNSILYKQSQPQAAAIIVNSIK